MGRMDIIICIKKRNKAKRISKKLLQDKKSLNIIINEKNF